MIKNIIKFTVLGPAIFLSMHSPVHAEGGDKRTRTDDGAINGNWGVNRRVATRPGYSQVSGSATIGFGPDENLGQKNWLTYRDSPTFYFGATGGTEIDAGFQYDLNSLNPENKPNKILKPENTLWLFIRRTTMNPIGVWDNEEGGIMWQGGRTTSFSSGDLNFKILEEPESAQGLVQRAGCISLTSSKIGGEAFYFTAGPALVSTNLSGGAQRQTNVMQVVSTQGMSVGDDIDVGDGDGLETGRIIDLDRTTRTININVNFVRNHPVGENIRITHRTKTTLQTSIAATDAGESEIVVSSGLGLAKTDTIRIGAHEAVITDVDPENPNAFTISSETALPTYAAGTLVTWMQFPNKAYANHPVAPWYGHPVFTPANSGTWRMKRVIGMTRATGTTEELDGSWLTSFFTNGMVKKSGEATSHNWDATDVDQTPTGYDAIESGAEAYDQRTSTEDSPLDANQLHGGVPVNDTSKTKVEFPKLTVTITDVRTLPPYKIGQILTGENANLVGRLDSHDSRAAVENGFSRYHNETVNINLKRYVTKEASAVQPTKASEEPVPAPAP